MCDPGHVETRLREPRERWSRCAHQVRLSVNHSHKLPCYHCDCLHKQHSYILVIPTTCMCHSNSMVFWTFLIDNIVGFGNVLSVFFTGNMIMFSCLDIYHSYAIVFDKHYGGTMFFL